MVGFERKDISLTPKWAWIIWGDGYMAEIVSMLPGKNANGEDVWKLKIIPTEELAKRYNIGMDILSEDLTLNVEYPLEMIKPLSVDPAWTIYFCFLSFKGYEVEATKFLKGYHDQERIRDFKKIIDELEAENAYLKEKLSIAESNIQEYIEKFINGPATRMSAQFIAQQEQPVVNPIRGV